MNLHSQLLEINRRISGSPISRCPLDEPILDVSSAMLSTSPELHRADSSEQTAGITNGQDKWFVCQRGLNACIASSGTGCVDARRKNEQHEASIVNAQADGAAT